MCPGIERRRGSEREAELNIDADGAVTLTLEDARHDALIQLKVASNPEIPLDQAAFMASEAILDIVRALGWGDVVEAYQRANGLIADSGGSSFR